MSDSPYDSLPPATPPAPRRPATSINGWLVVVLVALTGVLIYRMYATAPSPLHDPDALPRAVAPRGDLGGEEQSQIALFQQASPTVVHITTSAFGRDRVSMNLTEIPQGSGSGFVWDADGHVVTNYHVIQGAVENKGRAQVILADNSSWDARYVGAAPDKDVAVLKIDAPRGSLTPIPIGESAKLLVGQKVFAIGNPFSLDQTLTTGVISGLGREIRSVTNRPIRGVIQTDAAINPGNSGGPLLDSAGRLIGVNTAIYSPSGAYAGIGFAVPVDTVNRIVPILIRDGKVDRPGLGVHLFDDATVSELISRKVINRNGALVRDVVPGSSADAAGLQPTRRSNGQLLIGDLIVAIDEKPVANQEDLFDALSNHKVDDVVEVQIVREGTEQTVPVTLQALPTFEP